MFTVVVPTMKRKQTNFDYLENSLKKNKFILQNNLVKNRYIFVYKGEENMISDIIKDYKFSTIYRNEEDDYYRKINNTFSKDTYNYWRSHLCLDFAYSMNQVLDRADTKYIMWLEDDVIVDETIFNEILLIKNISAVSGYSILPGFPCMVFERTYLMKLIKKIYENYIEDIPLDYYIKNFGLDFNILKKKYAFHIGKISSRTDETIIRSTSEKYANPKTIDLLIKTKNQY